MILWLNIFYMFQEKRHWLTLWRLLEKRTRRSLSSSLSRWTQQLTQIITSTVFINCYLTSDDLWWLLTCSLRRIFSSCWRQTASTKVYWDVSQKSSLYTRYFTPDTALYYCTTHWVILHTVSNAVCVCVCLFSLQWTKSKTLIVSFLQEKSTRATKSYWTNESVTWATHCRVRILILLLL